MSFQSTHTASSGWLRTEFGAPCHAVELGQGLCEPHLCASALLGQDAEEVLGEVAQERWVPVPVAPGRRGAAGPWHVRPAGQAQTAPLAREKPTDVCGSSGAQGPARQPPAQLHRWSWELRNHSMPPSPTALASALRAKGFPSQFETFGSCWSSLGPQLRRLGSPSPPRFAQTPRKQPCRSPSTAGFCSRSC